MHPGWIPTGGKAETPHSRGAHRPGRRGDCGCDEGDTRLSHHHGHQHHQPHRAPGRSMGHGQHHGGGQWVPSRDHSRRHGWMWSPKKQHWIHVEPWGERELAPGRLVHFIGREVPRGLLPHGFPRMHVTPANFMVHHPPPGRIPDFGIKRSSLVHAPSVHVAGHYGWSPVLHKHVWIGAHKDGPTVSPAGMTPQQREGFAHMAKLSKQKATAYAHAHTYWGAGGARTSVIPGHWQWEKSKKAWQYIEPHADHTGRPTTMTYAVEHAPPAAFGERPRYLPRQFFWPDHDGTFRDSFQRTPSGAPTSITLPPHARYARANGLMDPALSRNVMQANATQRAASAQSTAEAAQNKANAQAHNAQVFRWRANHALGA